MPKDDWAKYRSRDIGRAALRNGTAFRCSQKAPKKGRRNRSGLKTAKSESFLSPAEWLLKLANATTNEQLDAIGRDFQAVEKYLRRNDLDRIIAAGKDRRRQLRTGYH